MRQMIEAAYGGDLEIEEAASAVSAAIELLDNGEIRVAEPIGDRDGNEPDDWQVNDWVKEAILLYFRLAGLETWEVGPFEFHDKIPIKKGLAEAGVRVVPPGTVRYGAFCESGVVVMPGYVNIGSRVGAGTMVDTWATVGSCAQIGSNVHLSGGVGIGGVLEPPNARPVIVGDGAFIGSRCIVTEGALIGAGAILGANTTLTASIPIIDVTGDEPIEYRNYVPPRAVVVPGTRPREFPSGTVQLACAYIIGQRSEDTDSKLSLNDALRTHGIAV
jgi:2,3,4,5-tetrahydropyridine-2-carboxylate N-succinyltransferase